MYSMCAYLSPPALRVCTLASVHHIILLCTAAHFLIDKHLSALLCDQKPEDLVCSRSCKRGSLLALQYTGVTDYRVILTKWDNIIGATGSSHYWDS